MCSVIKVLYKSQRRITPIEMGASASAGPNSSAQALQHKISCLRLEDYQIISAEFEKCIQTDSDEAATNATMHHMKEVLRNVINDVPGEEIGVDASVPTTGVPLRMAKSPRRRQTWVNFMVAEPEAISADSTTNITHHDQQFMSQQAGLIALRDSTGYPFWSACRRGWADIESYTEETDLNRCEGVSVGTMGMTINLSGCNLVGQVC